MPTFAIAIGVALILLGAVGYMGSGGASVTALIPAFFGALIALSGVGARNPQRRKLWMHVAVLLATIGLLGGLMGLRNGIAMLQGEAVPRPAATVSQMIMAALCLVFVVAAVRSFINARRAR